MFGWKTHAEIISEQDAEWERYRREMDMEGREIGKARAAFLRNTRPARPSDLVAFLRARTKPPTHFYGYNMPRDRTVVLQRTCRVPKLCGADALTIIVPHGMLDGLIVEDCGHNRILCMDKPDNASFAPSYDDANLDDA